MGNFFSSEYRNAGENGHFTRLAVFVPAVFFVYNFMYILSVPHELSVFNMKDFAVIFPFYLPLAVLNVRLTWFLYALLYMTGSVFYLTLIYVTARWAERKRQKIKQRPRFISKHI